MASKALCLYISGMSAVLSIDFVINAAIANKHNSNQHFYNHGNFIGQLRFKRNASDYVVNDSSPGSVADPEVVTSSWMADLVKGTWYGSEDYMKRKSFLKNMNTKPTICFNNVTADKNGTVYGHFICPMVQNPDTWVKCCGQADIQRCCPPEETGEDDDTATVNQDLDLVTGLSIAAGLAASITVCMTLYCCCCQKRPEIRSGIKMMWVRRSFKKELNRLETPTYVSHLSAHSRGGSAVGSRQGSRGPSPSISRRHSNVVPAPSPRMQKKDSKRNKKHSGESEDALVPNSAVRITVTTPSDDQGPAHPLLKTKKEEVNT